VVPRPAGGIGTAYQQLALALAGAGHRVVVLLSSAFRVDELEWTPWVQRIAAKGIELEIAPFPELPLTNTGCGWSCIKSYCIFEWLKRQLPVEFDVIHFPENLGLAYFPLLAKRQGLALGNSAIRDRLARSARLGARGEPKVDGLALRLSGRLPGAQGGRVGRLGRQSERVSRRLAAAHAVLAAAAGKPHAGASKHHYRHAQHCA
jgi:hypothetical protein